MLKRRWPGIIGTLRTHWARWAAVTWVVGLLSGCSMVSLGYNRLPDLGLLWLSRQLTLTDTQTAQVRTELTALLAWHRSTQLPPTADLLRRWQDLVAGDLRADQVCDEFAQIRGLLEALAQQATPALARLALGTNAEQIRELQRTHRKSNEEFRETHLSADPQASLSKRLGTLKDRYSQLYGSLTDAQIARLRESLQGSRFQPERTLAGRERRQAELIATLRTLQHPPSEPQDNRLKAQESVRGWLVGLVTPTHPQQAAYTQQLTREGCEQLAALHQTTTRQQRAHAIQTLRTYELDLRALAQR